MLGRHLAGRVSLWAFNGTLRACRWPGVFTCSLPADGTPSCPRSSAPPSLWGPRPGPPAVPAYWWCLTGPDSCRVTEVFVSGKRMKHTVKTFKGAPNQHVNLRNHYGREQTVVLLRNQLCPQQTGVRSKVKGQREISTLHNHQVYEELLKSLKTLTSGGKLTNGWKWLAAIWSVFSEFSCFALKKKIKQVSDYDRKRLFDTEQTCNYNPTQRQPGPKPTKVL